MPASENWHGASFRFFIALIPYILISLRICEVDEFANEMPVVELLDAA
jgi:hypothetical protein